MGLAQVLAHTASPVEIARAVSAMLWDPKWKHAASAFAADLPRFGNLELAAALVEKAAA